MQFAANIKQQSRDFAVFRVSEDRLRIPCMGKESRAGKEGLLPYS